VLDAIQSVWKLLFEQSRPWEPAVRSAANNLLIHASIELARIPYLAPSILDGLEVLARDPATDLKQLVEVATSVRRLESIPESVRLRLTALDSQITGPDLRSRVRRFVLLSSWEDRYADPGFEQRLSHLAAEAVTDRDALNSVMTQLSTSVSNAVYPFGFHLSKNDENNQLLELIKDSYRRVEQEKQTALLLGGYLRGVRDRDTKEWEGLLCVVIEEAAFARIAGALVQCSGVTDRAVEALIRGLDAKRLTPETLRSLRCAANELRELRESTVEDLVDRLLNFGEVSTAMEITYFAYCFSGYTRRLPRNLTRHLLTQEESERNRFQRFSYVWSEVARQYVTEYPEEQLTLFHTMIEAISDDAKAFHPHDYVSAVCDRIIQSEPHACWSMVATKLVGDDVNAWRMRAWLGPPHSFGPEETAGPLALFPLDIVLAWIDEAPSTRAPQIAAAAPKSFDSDGGGTLTRELLNRYGEFEDVRVALWRNFYSSGWSGTASDHYRQRRDQARTWLKSESSFQIRRWIEEYIQSLNESISRSEMEEERDD
jgi:hypothetical protein